MMTEVRIKMALKDKLVKLAGLKAVYDKIRGDIDDVNDDVDELRQKVKSRVISLNNHEVIGGGRNVIEAVGIPQYVDDVTQYSGWGITDSGWYEFCKITAPKGVTVSDETRTQGAEGTVIPIGGNHIDVAVRFDVAAESKRVDIHWGGDAEDETFVFRAVDLAVRNLDYRTTFYVYDIAEFATWSWKFAEDKTVDAAKFYFTKDGDTYTPVEAEAGAAIPAYYEQVISYALTSDQTFQDGKTYYTKDGDEYSAAEVVTGEAVTGDTYYEQSVSYAQTADATFQSEKTYFTKSTNVYLEAAVPPGNDVPAYYVHSKVSFAGMTRNITYVCNTVIDCPSEFILPEIEDDGHGAWFEIRFRHSGSFSSTLVPPDGVKIATEHTQAETAGINMVNLHYNNVGGVKLWRFMNTHSSIPA